MTATPASHRDSREYDGAGSVRPGPPGSMLEAWRRAVGQRAHSPAVYYFDQSFTFSNLDRASDALACALRDRGVRHGDRIALYLQNDPQWIVAMLAAWKCGASVACINPMLRAVELIHHVSDAAPQVLICLDQLYAEVITPIREDLPVQTIITTSPWDMVENGEAPAIFAAAWTGQHNVDGALQWREVLDDYDGHRPPDVVVTPDDTALVTFTSGTTGRAKGAMNLHRGVLHSARVLADWFDIDPDRDVILGIAPLFHITGSVAALALAIVAATPVVLLHRFDAATTLAAIEHRRATFTVAASTAYNALAGHPDVGVHDLSSLTKAACGGAPLSPGLVDKIRHHTGWTVRGVYGLTETTSPATVCPLTGEIPRDADSGALSVGVPVPGADIVLVDIQTGEPLPRGQRGEITVAGPMVIPGYWNAPEESAHAIRDGRLYTGDIGILSEDGWLYIVDRKKDLINAGGYKIWPREVEDILYLHPAVREAAVIGVPDDYRGETVKAVVSLERGARAEPGEIINFCRERLAAYKYPRIVEIVDDVPKNASGKILRRELRGSVPHVQTS